MNSAIDIRVLELHTRAIHAPVCRHLRAAEGGHVCLRCYGLHDPILCDVCIAEHRASHADDLCDLCDNPLGTLTADIAETLVDDKGNATFKTTWGRLVLGSVSVVGLVCPNCIAQHEMSKNLAN